MVSHLAPVSPAALSALAISLAMGSLASTAIAQDSSPGPTAAPELRLERVILSTGGVGLFHHSASVTGTATLTLPVRIDQVDDVLKSLRLSDPLGGGVAALLPVRAPLDEVFRALPLDPEDLSSPSRLLASFIGAELTISGPQSLTGRLLSVTPEAVLSQDGSEFLRHRIGLMTAQGLKQAILEDATGVAFSDPKIQQIIDKALAALSTLQDGTTRTIEVTLGAGSEPTSPRAVSLSYLAEVPLWKASYRLTLPPVTQDSGPQTDARLSGWAVLENLSGQDWTDVTLSVASGEPVTFQQALYDPYFVDRPSVPVEISGRVLPDADGGATAYADAPLAEAAPAMAPAPGMAPTMRMQVTSASPLDDQAGAPTALRQQAAAQTLFTFPAPVTLPNGHSLLMPLTQDGTEITRLAVYRPQDNSRHPLAAVSLKNDSGTALPPGAVTLYQAVDGGGITHLGDARLSTLPPDEERLLFFAVDSAVVVDREQSASRTVSGLSAANGVLRLREVERIRTTYTLTAPTDSPRRVVIEHPRRPDWETRLEPTPGSGSDAVPEPATRTRTDSVHRLGFDLTAGESLQVTLLDEHPVAQQVSIGSLSGPLFARLNGGDGLSDRERAAVERLAELAAESRAYENKMADLTRDRVQIAEDQARLRDNLQSVPEGSDLQRRYLERLEALEDRIEGIDTQFNAARSAADEARQTLERYISSLRLP